jgi:hypothetical protein
MRCMAIGGCVYCASRALAQLHVIVNIVNIITATCGSLSGIGLHQHELEWLRDALLLQW